MKSRYNKTVIDEVEYSPDGFFNGSCPICQIGIEGCKVCGGFGEVWTNDKRSFPLSKLQELREQDVRGLEQDMWEDNGGYNTTWPVSQLIRDYLEGKE